MASDKPQSEILDLLYDDELDEETRAAARRDVEQSDEAREELEAYETMLAKIRDADLDEDVPASVHDSIMASARKHATQKASRQAQVTRRAPTVSKPSKDSLWSRLNSSGVSQLVLAAAVVLVGGFLFVKIGTDQSSQKMFMAANEAVDQQVTFGGETASELAESAPAPKTTQPAEGEYAQLPPAEEAAEETKPKSSKDEATGKRADTDGLSKKSKIGELAQLDKRAEAEAPRREDRNTRRRARKSAPRKKASENDELEVFRGSSKPSVETKKSRPAPRAAEKQKSSAKLDDVFANKSDSSTSSASSKSGIADSADLGRSLGALADDSRSDSEAAPSSASGAVAQADSEPVPTQEGSGQEKISQEQTSSVNTMESNYRSGNFAGVVNEADRYLSRSSSDQADEARVLELKARALARQGKSSEADGVYAELQKKYPSYKSDQIRRERADLTEERKSKAKQRRQAPAEADKQMQYDFDDQEAAEPQPSSMDNAY